MYWVTKKGFEKLMENQKELERKLRELLSKKQDTAEQCGDLWHDNPTLYHLESEERTLRLRIKEISDKISSVMVIEEGKSGSENIVGVGSRVELEMESGRIKEITILDPELSDPDGGIISYMSPLGQAILGARVGDVVTYSVGQKKLQAKVLSIGGKNGRENRGSTE